MRLADSALRAGYRLNSFETLGSTNDEALARAVAGDRGRLWIVAAAQAAGRGRQGRTWASPPGNLYASLLLVDEVAPAQAWQLGFVGGVALAEAVTQVMGDQAARLSIKWPNDLLAGGAKLAGVLCEGTRLPNGRFAVALGFGVNRLSHPDGTPYPATNLFAVGGARPSLDTLFAALSARLPEALCLWEGGRAFEAVRTAWLAHAMPPGTPMSISARGGRTVGAFDSIDAHGRLLLMTDNGLERIEVGDVATVTTTTTTTTAPESSG